MMYYCAETTLFYSSSKESNMSFPQVALKPAMEAKGYRTREAAGTAAVASTRRTTKKAIGIMTTMTLATAKRRCCCSRRSPSRSRGRSAGGAATMEARKGDG